MHTLSLNELISALNQKQFSSVELVQYYLARIQQYAVLNAFIHLDEEGALNAAQCADQKRMQGQPVPLLTGIPIAHKDIFCTTRLPTTCGSKMLAQFQAPYDATIVQRLQQHGAILLGKTNMDEFAMGSANENSYFGPVKNPWNFHCVPGGSSGGSAAALAAGLVPLATGSDTGGSIRQPAAFCNLSGLKPTYGLVSRFGMVAYASSLDQAGPMAHSAEDLAIMLSLMAGFDERDSTSAEYQLPDYCAQFPAHLKGLKIGLPRSFFQSGVDHDIQQALHAAVEIFQLAGAEIIDLELTLQPLWVPCYYVIACAEASSNLSRYDGIRFGYRTPHAKDLQQLITGSRSEGFGLEVQRRILTGTYVLSSGYFDDYYVQAQKIRRMIQTELLQALQQVDVILGPTTPTCAFKLQEPVNDPTQRYLADVFTVAANLAGLPAISIPAGFNTQNLPIGMQLMGTHFSEKTLLNMAYCYQQYTDWHQKWPLRGEI